MGENTSGTGENAYCRGETASRAGETPYCMGENAYSKGETSYYMGETAYCEGESAHNTGENQYSTGESAYGKGEFEPDTGETSYRTGNSSSARANAHSAGQIARFAPQKTVETRNCGHLSLLFVFFGFGCGGGITPGLSSSAIAVPSISVKLNPKIAAAVGAMSTIRARVIRAPTRALAP